MILLRNSGLADVPIKIGLKISPENGGEITGLGNYYRWDRVV